MTKKRRDHFVPRLLIRQFCDERGRLFCFDKQQVQIPDRDIGNTPQQILHGRGFYTDPLGNLDEILYKPIEDAFGPHLHRLVRDPARAAQEPGFGRALIDWVAAQTSRTELVPIALEAVARRYGRLELLADQGQFAVKVNRARIHEFESMVELMCLPKWGWRMHRSIGKRRFVLGDHPVCNTTTDMAMGYMLFIPLSPTLMLVGGSDEGHRIVKEREILRGFNGYIMSWSRRYTYSACLPELESLEIMFNTHSDPEHDEWMRYAKHPHHGIANRILEEDLPEYLDPDFLRRQFS